MNSNFSFLFHGFHTELVEIIEFLTVDPSQVEYIELKRKNQFNDVRYFDECKNLTKNK